MSHKANKIENGTYEYRGYTIKNEGGTWFIYKDVNEHFTGYTKTLKAAKARVDLIAEPPVKVWVPRKNYMTGETFWEDEDTPYFCSPRSQTYFQM